MVDRTGNRFRRKYYPRTMAHRTRIKIILPKSLIGSLPCYFNKAKRCDSAYNGFVMIFLKCPLQRIKQFILLRFLIHINEINENDSSDFPKFDLSCNLNSGFLVDQESRLAVRDSIPFKGS